MRILLVFTSFITLFGFFSCQSDDFSPETNKPIENSYEGVDSRLWTYWESFETEAAARGMNINLTSFDLIGIIVEIQEDHVAGSCTYGGNAPRTIRLDQSIWNDLSPLFREFIVFHELGHCILMRDHDESINQQGMCLSIMRSGLNGCRDNYNLNTRDLYLDELFGELP